MQNSFEVRFLKWLQKKEHPLYEKPLLFFLWLLSFLFATWVFIRTVFFKIIKNLSFYTPYHPPQGKVISIGNITLGGTGKTPFTLFLAQKLEKENAAIFLRGYKSQIEKKGVSEKMLKKNASYFGDEATLYFEELKKTPIFVGKNRIASLKLSLSEKISYFLLDDAFQNESIKKDLSIVLLDAENPLGSSFFPPRGLLRSFPSSLKNADFLIFHSGTLSSPQAIKEPSLLSLIKNKPFALTGLQVEGIFDLNGVQQEVKGLPCSLFSAIAKPHKFQETVLSLHHPILSTYFLEDHGLFEEKALFLFAEEAKEKGASFLLCTYKDKVKLDKKALSLPLPIFWLKTSLIFFSGYNSLEKLLKIE